LEEVGRPNKDRDEGSRSVATTFLFRGSQGKKKKISEEERARSGWKRTAEGAGCERYPRKWVKVPRKFGKMLEDIGSGWKWLEGL